MRVGVGAVATLHLERQQQQQEQPYQAVQSRAAGLQPACELAWSPCRSQLGHNFATKYTLAALPARLRPALQSCRRCCRRRPQPPPSCCTKLGTLAPTWAPSTLLPWPPAPLAAWWVAAPLAPGILCALRCAGCMRPARSMPRLARSALGPPTPYSPDCLQLQGPHLPPAAPPFPRSTLPTPPHPCCGVQAAGMRKQQSIFEQSGGGALDWQIQEQDLRFIKIIGEGAIGKVGDGVLC